MALYHKNLKHHEDKTEKHCITDEDINFLVDLQKEMNTQSDVGQADPRFWVIKGSECICRIEDDADGYCLYNSMDCEAVAKNLKSAFEFIRDEILPDINECAESPITIKFDQSPFFEEMGEIIIEENDSYLNELEEIEEWLNENTYGGYEFVSYKRVEKIYQDTMFLTQKAAEKHLRANDYHYSEDAHTYAMTSWRNPETEQLWKILRGVDWNRLLDKNTESTKEDDSDCWYQERWHEEDLEIALEQARIVVNEENLRKIKAACKGIFDNKTIRNEMLKQVAEEIFVK